MSGPLTKNADRKALVLMLNFKELLNDTIQQHDRLHSYILANMMISVAHELIASTYLPQKFAPDVPDVPEDPKATEA